MTSYKFKKESTTSIDRLTQIWVSLEKWVSRFLLLIFCNTKIREGAAKWDGANNNGSVHFQVQVHSRWVDLELKFTELKTFHWNYLCRKFPTMM